MKANELMIGDWVVATEVGKPVQITAIADANVAISSFPHFAFINGIEPIILTSEILEKNFPDTEILVWYGNKDKWHIECPAFEDLQVKIEIKYVHQLQHVLNLLEIERQIVL